MQNWFRKNGKALGAIAVLGSVAAFSLGKPPAGCPASPLADSFISPQTPGEYPMSTYAPTGAVQHTDESGFVEDVLRSDVPVLVDFYADWCGPCRALGPVLHEVAQEAVDAKVVKVNVDDSPRLAAHYRIEALPSLMVFKNGQVSARHVGMANKARLKVLLEQ